MIVLLRQKTHAGHLKWNVTADEDAFQCSLADHNIVIHVQRRPDGVKDIVVAVYNEEGRLVDIANDVELTDVIPESYAYLSQFHDEVRRNAMGVDKALDSILGALGAVREDDV